MLRRERLGDRDAEALREHRARALFTFISPKPGAPRAARAARRRRALPSRSGPRRRRTPRATVAASSWTRAAIEPGKRWIGRLLPNAASRSGRSRRSFGSSVPSRCLSLSGPANACLHRHLLVEREPDEERERIRGEQPVRLVVVREVEAVGRAMPRSYAGVDRRCVSDTRRRVCTGRRGVRHFSTEVSDTGGRLRRRVVEVVAYAQFPVSSRELLVRDDELVGVELAAGAVVARDAARDRQIRLDRPRRLAPATVGRRRAVPVAVGRARSGSCARRSVAAALRTQGSFETCVPPSRRGRRVRAPRAARSSARSSTWRQSAPRRARLVVVVAARRARSRGRRHRRRRRGLVDPPREDAVTGAVRRASARHAADHPAGQIASQLHDSKYAPRTRYAPTRARRGDARQPHEWPSRRRSRRRSGHPGDAHHPEREQRGHEPDAAAAAPERRSPGPSGTRRRVRRASRAGSARAAPGTRRGNAASAVSAGTAPPPRARSP